MKIEVLKKFRNWKSENTLLFDFLWKNTLKSFFSIYHILFLRQLDYAPSLSTHSQKFLFNLINQNANENYC